MEKNLKSKDFGNWFRTIVNTYPQIKKKTIASQAGISAASFSKILNSRQRVTDKTAKNLMSALNDILGFEAVKISEGLFFCKLAKKFSLQNNTPQKIYRYLASADSIKDFDDLDFDWLMQMIAIRALWKKAQKQENTVSVVSESSEFFDPPVDPKIDEPLAIIVNKIPPSDQ